MTRPRPARVDPLRLALVVTFLVTSVWMFGLFLFPAAWQDRHGYNQLGFLIIASGLHVPVGLVMWLFTAWKSRVSQEFVYLVVITPAVHVVGAALDTPWCFVPFVGPSVVIGVMFTVEVVRYLHPTLPDELR